MKRQQKGINVEQSHDLLLEFFEERFEQTDSDSFTFRVREILRGKSTDEYTYTKSDARKLSIYVGKQVDLFDGIYEITTESINNRTSVRYRVTKHVRGNEA